MVNRPPYLIAYPANQDGGGYYRMIEPVRAMKDAGHILGEVRPTMLPAEHIAIVHPDKVFWHQQMSDPQIDVIKSYRKAGIFQVYDTDDLILSINDIPVENIHRGSFGTDLKTRWRKVVGNIDRITVSTEPLKAFFDKLHADVHVLPNMIPRNVLESIPLSFARSDKPRIGWAGGLSHTGDLAFLKEVMDELGDTVHWVFMGMVPPGALNPDLYTQMPPKPCGTHIQAMAEMHLDLALAPLAISDYNRCKSNLKILEYGACGFPVLATDIDPYSDAPVFFPASGSAADWAGAIRDLISDRDLLERSGADLRNWVWRNYTLEDGLDSRIKAWDGYEQAEFMKEQGGVILAQPNVILPADFEDRVKAIVDQHPEIGTLSFWGNDNEYLSYPSQGQFTPLNETIAEQMDCVAKSLFDDAVEPVPFPVGQVIWVSPRAAVECGALDDDMQTHSGQWMEYGKRVADRGFVNYAATGIFTATWLPQRRDNAMAQEDAQCLLARYPSLKTDIHDVQGSSALKSLRGRIEATYMRMFYPVVPVKGEDFTTAYNHWAQVFERDMWMRETNLKFVIRAIGDTAPLSDDADYYVFTHEKDILHRNAIKHFITSSKDRPAIIYGDEDTMTNGMRSNPYFKTDYNYELLLSHNYIGRGAAIRADLVDVAPSNEMEYYDMLFQAIEKDASVVHVPFITVHRHPTPPTPSPVGLHLKRIGKAAMMSPHHSGFNIVQYAMPDESVPMVSIIIPTKNNATLLSRCIKSLESTDYPNYEILVADNGSTDKDAKRLLEVLKSRPKTRVLNIPCAPFNYSVVNNRAALGAKGEYLCLLNDDIEVKTPYWLNLMMRSAVQEGIGAVGAKLLYPNNTVQHTGVVLGMPIVADHKLKGIGANDPGYFGQAICLHEVTAVTGACLLVSREAWNTVGGLPEKYAVAYGDVAFCLALRKAGYRNLIQPQAVMLHHESASRGMDDTPEKFARHMREAAMLREEYDLTDPFWNPNLALTPQPAMAFPPRTPGMDSRSGTGILYINRPRDARWGDLPTANVFEMETVDYSTVGFISPDSVNLPNLNVLDKAEVWRQVLDDLGVTEIIVGELRGASPALLNLLDRLSDTFSVFYQREGAITLCPRGNAKTPSGPCGDLWKEESTTRCQECINTHGSPYGYVDVSEWRITWASRNDSSDT
jgi:GT2 family glycosyltransferase/glycosyltransferase involved in cell wall biosynthesis